MAAIQFGRYTEAFRRITGGWPAAATKNGRGKRITPKSQGESRRRRGGVQRTRTFGTELRIYKKPERNELVIDPYEREIEGARL